MVLGTIWSSTVASSLRRSTVVCNFHKLTCEMQGAVMSCELACLYFQLHLAVASAVQQPSTTKSFQRDACLCQRAGDGETFDQDFYRSVLVKSPQKPTRWSVPVSVQDYRRLAGLDTEPFAALWSAVCISSDFGSAVVHRLTYTYACLLSHACVDLHLLCIYCTLWVLCDMR